MTYRKWTPGPWAYEAHGDTGTYGVGVCHDISDIEMAFPLSGEVESTVMVVDPVAPEVNGRENAALIASAPDLYDALEHAQRNMPHPDQLIDETLAKARGEV